MYAPDQTPSPAGGSSENEPQRNARYAYLVARLRNRQMTMEEATELFGIMQGMLRTSEQARLALARVPPPPPQALARPAPRTPPPTPASSSDDFLLLGLLAMGAGAGLLAAMTKRLQDVTSPPAPEGKGPPKSGASSR